MPLSLRCPCLVFLNLSSSRCKSKNLLIQLVVVVLKECLRSTSKARTFQMSKILKNKTVFNKNTSRLQRITPMELTLQELQESKICIRCTSSKLCKRYSSFAITSEWWSLKRSKIKFFTCPSPSALNVRIIIVE